jgi:hypothetical protein
MVASLHDLPDAPIAHPDTGSETEVETSRLRFVRRRAGRADLEAAE